MDESRTGYAETAFTNGYEFTQGSGYRLPEYPFVEPAGAARRAQPATTRS